MSEVPALEARGIRATRPGPDGPREVLRDVSLALAPGEAVALVGPSGCGKSTLLGAVAGLEPIDAGEVLLGGAPAPDRLGRLTLMPQRDALLPWRTAGDNVALAARLAGRGRRDARRAAEAALAELGLLDHAEHYPHALSGGMRQRVSLARTLAAGGDAWLLDEPFGALDALTRARLQADLDRERRARDATVLLVTHDLDEALLLSDRVLVSSPRPMRIVADVPVAIDRGRGLATTADPAFGRLKLALLEALADVGALA